MLHVGRVLGLDNPHTDAQRRRRRFDIGRVLVLNNPHGGRGGGGDSTSAERLISLTPLPRADSDVECEAPPKSHDETRDERRSAPLAHVVDL